ncbi:carotenoid 9,10(9',10')-cleavage dioxygenase-like isoform X1 [Panicum virgatum]
MGAAEAEQPNGLVVVPEPRPIKGLASWALDLLESVAVRLGHDKAKPLHWLSGNFGPVVDETPPAPDLPVRGHLPECLNGEFVRVGPNPKFVPVAGYHWFDGDGMIHAMRIKDGKATYVSRYVKTARLKQEEYFGGAKFMKIGDLKGFFGLFMVQMQQLRKKFKVLDFTYGFGTANTALIYHHGKLMALSEADKPYVVKVLEDGDLQTLGLLDYDKRLKHSFTAHPKVDPFTDEMFTFGYSHEPPYCTYRVITKDGSMLDPVPITIPESVMMHDFAITENYSIFMDLPLLFRPKEMVKNGEFIYKFDPTKKARFGILPRYAKDDKLIRWFELPNCFIFHNANAWEEGDEVVLVTCRLENPDLDKVNGHQSEKLENFGNELYEMRFNMKTGVSSQKQLSVSAVDFPRVNESYTGRKQRYVYCTILDSIAKVTGIIKFDLHAEPESGKKELEVGGNIQGIYDLGPGRFGSEAIFVPKQPGVSGGEDDGYLIFFVHDENTGKSEVNVIDAKTMSADPVAVVELPNRVPYGFHAFFVTEEQLAQQAE